METIDTIRLRTITNDNEQKSIIDKSTLNTVTASEDGEVIATHHKVHGMHVKFKGMYTTIELSLPKFRHGNNIEPLKHSNLKNVFDEMESALGISVLDAYLSRVDIAQNIVMEHDCQFYFNELLMKGNYKQQDYKPGINFFNTEIGLHFYDKIKENEDKGRIKLPDEFVGKHLLRYEFRISRHLNDMLNRDGIVNKHVTVGDLLDRNVYNYLIDRSYQHYLKIIKGKVLLPCMELQNPSDFKNYLAYRGMIACGGEARVRKSVQTHRRAKTYTNSSQPYRILEMIGEITKNGYLCKENPFVKELNMKMAQAALMSYC